MITFVTFHVDTSKETSDQIPNLHTGFKHKKFYELMINLLFRSISIYHENCRKVVLTDYSTEITGLQNDVELYRVEIDTKYLMLSRLKAQIEFLTNHDFSSDVVFLDADILVNKNLESVFEKDFNVGLTYRETHKTMPVNGAVIFVSNTNKEYALHFLNKIHDIYTEKYLNHSLWWGDQYALIDAIGHEKFLHRTSEFIQIDRVKILLLPCDYYNFSPQPNFSSIAFELSDKKIIHFKGKRKKLINPYWMTYLNIQENSNFVNFMQSIFYRLSILAYFLLDRFKFVK
ncbi:MAG: hypothetical protein F6K10_10985 [Moorea sp. SIO2B7]|nr:hypothetical protein [Moorena sp. SIO2B7]